MNSRRGKEMIINSRTLQFNRPGSCKETIPVLSEHLDNFHCQVKKKVKRMLKMISRIRVTLQLEMMMEQRQTLKEMTMQVQT